MSEARTDTGGVAEHSQAEWERVTHGQWPLLLQLVKEAVGPTTPLKFVSTRFDGGVAGGEFEPVDPTASGIVVSRYLRESPVVLLPEWGDGLTPRRGAKRDSVSRRGQTVYLYEPTRTLAKIKTAASNPLVVLLPERLLSGPNSSVLRRDLMKRFDLGVVVTVEPDNDSGRESLCAVVLVNRGSEDYPKWFSLKAGELDRATTSQFRNVLKFHRQKGKDDPKKSKSSNANSGGKDDHESSGLGYAIAREWVRDSSWSFNANHPDLNEKAKELASLGETVALESVATIFRGSVKAKEVGEQGVIPSYGRNLVFSAENAMPDGTVSFDPRRLRKPPASMSQGSSCGNTDVKAGDLIVVGRGFTDERGLRVVRVEPGDLPIRVTKSDFIVRFHDEVTDDEQVLVFRYLQSGLAKSLLQSDVRKGVWEPQLRQLPVPRPDSDTTKAFHSLRLASQGFQQLSHDADEVLESAFNSADDEEIGTSIRRGSLELRAKHEAAKKLDDFEYQVLTQYPYPIAHRYRELLALNAEVEREARYEKTLVASEVVVTFLGNLLLAFARENERVESLTKRLRAQLTKGTGMGDWSSVLVQGSGKDFAKAFEPEHPACEVSAFAQKTETMKALSNLVERRNAKAHWKALLKRNLDQALSEAHEDLLTLLRGCRFLIDHRLVEISYARFDSIQKVTSVQYRELVGDSVAVPNRQPLDIDGQIEDKSLYFLDAQGNFHLLRPFLTIDFCLDCDGRSVFFIEKLIDGIVRLKSLSDGHTTSSRETEVILKVLDIDPEQVT